MKVLSLQFGRTRYWLPALVVMLPLVFILAGCNGRGSSNEIEMVPISEMPEAVQNAAVSVQEAYQFAVANPDDLKNVACYCGCDDEGHTSNYSCYVKEVKPSGEIDFDQHALGCTICVDITQDVMKMTREGKKPVEIRAAIDQTYSQYGPSNMPSGQ